MSADLMLVSSEQDQNFDNNHEACIRIDEVSAGNIHTDFGRIVTTGGNVITDEFIEKVKEWYKKLEHKDYVDIKKVTAWLKKHKGESLEWERW